MFEDVLILKKGGIHIKKENIGSFTRYCGGNVTQECIERGKNSPSAAIRKKSVFADNARRWKHENGGILKAQAGTGTGFWSKLWNAVKEGGMVARDAKLGAVGAQQVRDLYSEGKNQEAQDLAKQYAKANTTGITLAGGAASTGLLGDLMVTGATTVADTFIDGDVDNFGKNLIKNAAGDLIGHGVGKVLNKGWNRLKNLTDGSYKLRDAEWYMRVRDGKPPIDDLPEYQEYKRTGNTRLLDKTYNGELVVSPKVGLERRVNTLADRQKFIREHPVSNYSGPTDAPMTIEDALEEAGQFRAKYQHQLDEAIGDIKYDSELSNGILGHTEGTSLGYMYYGRGPRRKANIRVSHAQGSNDTMDAITDLHELHHATGNSDDGYIYNYLKENGIVNWDNVAPYYKDSDRGEIGAHLSELPDYLGFTKEPGKRYQTAYGKRTINEEDIKNFMRFNEQRGFRQNRTIWGNIKNMKAFLDFMNKHKFAITAPTIGVATTLSNSSKNNELQ